MIESLNAFIADYNKFGASYISSRLGIPRTIVGNGAALLSALGFAIEKRTPTQTKVEFDTNEAERLFSAGAGAKEIAEHLGVKKISVTSHLRRAGLITKPVPISDILKAEAGAEE